MNTMTQFVKMPTCQRCGSTTRLRCNRSQAQGDGSKLRWMLCTRCGCKWHVVAEPDEIISQDFRNAESRAVGLDRVSVSANGLPQQHERSRKQWIRNAET